MYPRESLQAQMHSDCSADRHGMPTRDRWVNCFCHNGKQLGPVCLTYKKQLTTEDTDNTEEKQYIMHIAAFIRWVSA